MAKYLRIGFVANYLRAEIMINFSVGLRPNPMKPDEAKKAYAYVQARETMDINKFAEHISTHGCVYGQADIAAVLTMAVDCIREIIMAADCNHANR